MWKQENTNIFDKKNVALRYLSSSAFLAIKPGKLEVYHFCTHTHSWSFAKSFLCRSPSHTMREWTFLEISRKRLVAQSPEHSFFFVMCYDPSLADGCYLVEQEGAYAFPEFLEFDICYRVHFYSPLKKFLSLSLMGAAQDSGIIAFRVSSGVQRNTLIAQSMVLTSYSCFYLQKSHKYTRGTLLAQCKLMIFDLDLMLEPYFVQLRYSFVHLSRPETL